MSTITTIRQQFLKCKNCGWVWPIRVENPKVCPRCHNPYWRKAKKYRERE